MALDRLVKSSPSYTPVTKWSGGEGKGVVTVLDTSIKDPLVTPEDVVLDNGKSTTGWVSTDIDPTTDTETSPSTNQVNITSVVRSNDVTVDTCDSVTGWTASNGGVVTTSTGQGGGSGNNSVKISRVSSSTESVIYMRKQYNLQLQYSEKFAVKFWAKKTGANYGGLANATLQIIGVKNGVNNSTQDFTMNDSSLPLNTWREFTVNTDMSILQALSFETDESLGGSVPSLEVDNIRIISRNGGSKGVGYINLDYNSTVTVTSDLKWKGMKKSFNNFVLPKDESKMSIIIRLREGSTTLSRTGKVINTNFAQRMRVIITGADPEGSAVTYALNFPALASTGYSAFTDIGFTPGIKTLTGITILMYTREDPSNTLKVSKPIQIESIRAITDPSAIQYNDFNTGYPVIDNTLKEIRLRASYGTDDFNGKLISEHGTFNTDSSRKMTSHLIFLPFSKSSQDVLVIDEIWRFNNE